ncbi:MAG: hypothetical protein KatS3mg104_2951 [Phycisphaerae bacterium]|nr:MAG: hypothetical protein KatS3mg104_2951 [Phycisphaerae bacterium]
MVKSFPTPFRHIGALSGATVPPEGGICKILANGSVEDLSGGGAAVAHAVFKRQREDDGLAEVDNAIVASFAGEAGNTPSIGDTVYVVNANTISTNSSAGSRPELGKCVGFAPDGTYYVFVKGLLS